MITLEEEIIEINKKYLKKLNNSDIEHMITAPKLSDDFYELVKEEFERRPPTKDDWE